MELKVERTSPVAWSALEGIIPPEYIAYLKKDCINKNRITVYTASESKEAALGYLVLTPIHHSRTMYEIAHMQVVLEETGKHIGSKLIHQVAEDLKRNKIKTLIASFDEEDDDEDILESFFEANGFEHQCTYSVQRYSVQQVLDSLIRKRLYEVPLDSHFKRYDELTRIMKGSLINEKKLMVNAGNKDSLQFMVMDNQVVAISGIYHMKDRIILDDILVFDRTKLRDIVLYIWAYLVDFVCNTYEEENYHTVEIVVPNIKYEEVAEKLIGEPISKTIKKKMILDLKS